MLEGQLMFAHLAQNGTNIQMNVRWIEHLKAVINAVDTEVQIVVFYFKRLLKVAEGWSKLLCSSEYTSKVIVSYSSIFVAIFG